MVTAAMNTSATSGQEEGAVLDGDNPSYAYKAGLMSAPWEFSLTAKGLAWQLGRRSGLIRYDQVRRVRLSFRPSSLQSYRFLTEIWSPEHPKIQIYSASFRSLMEQQRQDAAYSAFVTELHKRLAAAGSSAQFESGMNPVMYWLGAAVMTAGGLALAWMLVRTLTAGDLAGTGVIAAVIAVCVWQVGRIFHRNRPQTYRPDAVPSVVLPRS